MREHDTNCTGETSSLEAPADKDTTTDGFDPARVFADPVAYLARFGLRSELAETHHSGFAAAA